MNSNTKKTLDDLLTTLADQRKRLVLAV